MIIRRPADATRTPKPIAPRTAAVIAGVAVAGLVLTSCASSGSSTSSSGTGAGGGTHSVPKKPPANCSSTGCAAVRRTAQSPHLTVFYGGSCSGAVGAWFLNATQGGSTTTPVASYHLKWTFSAQSTHALPNGTIAVTPAAGGKPIEMTLQDGTLTITGTAADGSSVNAQGTLAVDLSGSSSGSTLTVTERGLSSAESALGLTSPFALDGASTVLPVTMTSNFAGC